MAAQLWSCPANPPACQTLGKSDAWCQNFGCLTCEKTTAIPSCPVSAKGEVQDGKVVLEELVRVARGRGEVTHGSTPLFGRGLVGLDVVRDRLSGELYEPHARERRRGISLKGLHVLVMKGDGWGRGRKRGRTKWTVMPLASHFMA